MSTKLLPINLTGKLNYAHGGNQRSKFVAEKETNGLVKEVLPSWFVENSTRLIFATAFYIRGAWYHKFDSSEGGKKKKWRWFSPTVKVSFMTSQKNRLVCAFYGSKVLRLLINKELQYMFLPHVRNGLPTSVAKMNSEFGFSSCHYHLSKREVEMCALKTSRFKIAFRFDWDGGLSHGGLGPICVKKWEAFYRK